MLLKAKLLLDLIVGIVVLPLLASCQFSTTAAPPLKWNTHVGDPPDTWINESVAIGPDLVYVSAGQPQAGKFPCESRNYVQAFDKATGTWKWHHEMGGCGATAPTFFEDRVYIASSRWALQAMDAQTGRLLWTFPSIENVVEQPPMGYPFLYDPAKPAVDNERVYIVSMYSDDLAVYRGERKDGGSSLLAVNRQSGKLEWEFRVDKETDGEFTGPTVSQQAVSFVDDKILYVVDPQTGAELWHSDKSRYIIGPPTWYDSELYVVGYSDRSFCIFSFDEKTGAEQQRLPMQLEEGSVYSGQAYWIGNHLFAIMWISIGFRPPTASLYALDLESGQIRWHSSFGEIKSNSLLLYDDTTIYLSTYQAVYAINQQTGQRRWRFVVRNGLGSEPALENNVLYIGDTGGDLHAILISQK